MSCLSYTNYIERGNANSNTKAANAGLPVSAIDPSELLELSVDFSELEDPLGDRDSFEPEPEDRELPLESLPCESNPEELDDPEELEEPEEPEETELRDRDIPELRSDDELGFDPDSFKLPDDPCNAEDASAASDVEDFALVLELDLDLDLEDEDEDESRDGS